ncbi:MAG: hypothetical protein NTW27_00260 [Deltaproteobacteria bacterium]|nr:hypothetical protein [Deltaproteobacteria bacterium]
MDNLENVIYSLIPLVLILLLSWLFSSMGSKAKKQLGERERTPAPLPGEQLLDLISGAKSGKESSPMEVITKPTNGFAQQTTDGWGRRRSSGASEVTPEPIKPKWWGA